MAYLYIILLIFFVNIPLHAEENPFARLQGKTYAENTEVLRQLYIDIDFGQEDSLYYKNLIGQLKELAEKTNDKSLLLEYKRLMISYHFREKYRDDPRNTYKVDNAILDLQNLLAEAEKEKETIHVLRFHYSLLNLYIYVTKNYEQAFLTAQQLDKELLHIEPDEFPDMLYYYTEIANLHYQFREYEKAEIYYKKILEYPELAYEHYVLMSAYNGLGLIYLTYHKQYDEAERWFQSIIDLEANDEKMFRALDEWDGIAYGNIGEAKILRGEYDQAISDLLFSLDKVLFYQDYSFASSSAILLAEAYMRKGNYPLMKKYLDSSADYNKISWRNRDHLIFPLYSKYYTITGNKEKAMLYLDSAIIAQNKYTDDFNAMHLLRAEQKTALIEQASREQELNAERVKSKSYQLISITVSFTLILVVILLLYLNVVYRKKQDAYKELVRKAREWALHSSTRETKVFSSGKKGDYDSLINQIYHLTETGKIYLDGEVSVESFASKLSVNKTLLSQAFNRGIGKNFNQFINEYRVKESIKIMTEKASFNYSIDQIASFSGFNDRKTFYRIFKSITGISPSEYRDNIRRQEDEDCSDT